MYEKVISIALWRHEVQTPCTSLARSEENVKVNGGYLIMDLLQDTKTAGWAWAGNVGNVFAAIAG